MTLLTGGKGTGECDGVAVVGDASFPDVFVETLVAAVKLVCPLVNGQLDRMAVEIEIGPADPVGVAADGGAEVVVVGGRLGQRRAAAPRRRWSRRGRGTCSSTKRAPRLVSTALHGPTEMVMTSTCAVKRAPEWGC